MSDIEGTLWRPSASRFTLESRARLLSDIRSFFAQRKVMEVETAILSRAGNTDPNIACKRTDSLPAEFLRTSPEYPMKRLLAAGLGDIYEMGRVFRSGEVGAWHNPEFTLLEWYRKDWNYLDLAEEVIELVRHCAAGRFDHWKLERYSYQQLFKQHTGLDPYTTTESEWALQAQERNLRAGPMDVMQWQDLMLTHVIQPVFDPECFTMIYDYPPEQAALARIRQDKPAVAERFEVYLGPVELANGYQELLDPTEQQQRFDRDNRLRHVRGDEQVIVDQHLIDALQHGLPVCAGVALGVDRLLMRLMELNTISAVLAFPHDRA